MVIQPNDTVPSDSLETNNPRFQFSKGGEDLFAKAPDAEFNWQKCAIETREHLRDAMNARNLSFLLGSGCSSLVRSGEEFGIPTMAPLAKEFLNSPNPSAPTIYLTDDDVESLLSMLGINIKGKEFENNLERLMEVLFSAKFLLEKSSNLSFADCKTRIDSLISRVVQFIYNKCNTAQAEPEKSPVVSLYQTFYRRLTFRERTLPRPWVFTTNYDLFNEIALDRLGIPYCNGFSGSVERRFNPSSYRYALAEQLDITSRRWTSVDGYLYLCKLHGSINWIEDGHGLFPIREVPAASKAASRAMIYPTPAKQNASFGSPYSDLFREFQSQIVREQSVLVLLGYSFGDEHVNNIIYQALTIPSFRMIAFVNPNIGGVVERLRSLRDPRIWLIGGKGADSTSNAHYFDCFVENFMPAPPGNKVETAVEWVLKELLGRSSADPQTESSNEER